MPVCMRDGFDMTTNKNETFRDDEEVFFCEITMQIFRDYEQYFRHVMAINSTVWQCEITGKDNLTYAEALKSERRARKKMEMFKDSLRPMVMLLIDEAKQSSYKSLNAIVWKFLRKRYFLHELVSASHTGNNHKEYKVVEIIPPGKASAATAYEDTEQFQYKVSRKEPKTGKEEAITVPFENIRRNRFELTTDNLQMFIKHNVVRVDGLLRSKPESLKKYVTDRKITFASMFIGKMPHFTPAKIKKQVNLNDYLIKGAAAQAAAATTTEKEKNGGKMSAEAIKKREQEKAERAEAKKASLKEEMERLRREKQEKIAALEREKAEKRAKMMEKIESQCDEFLIKSDDLERTDQRLLPAFTPIKTLIPQKLIGDAILLNEFMHSFGSLLSGTDVFRNNISFMELSRAFTRREVAGPLSDILTILLASIFDMHREEDEECPVDYIKSRHYFSNTDNVNVMIDAGRTHAYTRRHFSAKLHELPVDSLTLSEVLRLHLLQSGAKVTDRAEKWRLMYRNGYSSAEDPGLRLRLQHPHILRFLRQYTVYHLPFLDIMRIVRCLIDQILTYSSTIGLIEDRMDQMTKAKLEIRNMTIQENRRQTEVRNQKRALTNEFNQACMDDAVKNDPAKKQQLEEKLNRKVADLMAQSEREHRKYEQLMKKNHTAIFNFLVYLGMDRAYRKYYVFESMPGLFVEHSPEVYDDSCLEQPPTNVLRRGLDVATLPKNRKDLRAHLLKLHLEQERKDKEAASAPAPAKDEVVVDPKIEKDASLTSSQENKENQENRSRSSLLNGHDKRLGLVKAEEDEEPVDLPPPTQTELYMCCGSKRDCIVHNDRHAGRTRWSYIYEKEDIEALIESLNPLGERESQLRDQLTLLKSLILSHVQKCPFDSLTIADKQWQKWKNVLAADTQRKYGKPNYGFPDGTDLNEVMHSALVEHIIKFERDVYTGDLGCLKVKDIEKWRKDLLNNTYDPQGKLQWGTMSNAEANGGQENGDELNGGGDDDDADAEPGATHQPFYCPGSELGDTMEIDTDDSEDDAISLHDSDTLKESVKQLASALLQVQQGVQRRFIKEPFGAPLKAVKDKDVMDRKIKSGAERLQQWEISLMESTSYSQVFLHWNVLHDSIIWARSTNKSSCQVCRRGSDPDKMLLCDECNGGTHMFCMKPKMTVVPEGNWYCKQCCQRLGLKNEADKKTRRSRKPAFVIDEEDNRSEVSSSSSSRSANRVSARISKKVLRGNEIEDILNEQEDDDEEDEEAEDEEGDEANEDDEGDEVEEENGDYDEDETMGDEAEDDDDVDEEEEETAKKTKHVNGDLDEPDEDEEENECVVCSYEGADVVCNSCKDSFHLECLNLKRNPRSFTCAKCKGGEERKRKHKPNGRHAMDDSDDGEEDEEVLDTSVAKRPRRSKNPANTSSSAESSQKAQSSRRSYRRTGDHLPLDNATLYELLDDVMKHEQAWPFLRPVSQSEVPDYYKIIKNPMDLAKVKSKLNMGKYQLNEEVLNDIQLVFSNCDEYNVKGNEIYNAGYALERFVIQRCKELGLPFKPSDMND